MVKKDFQNHCAAQPKVLGRVLYLVHHKQAQKLEGRVLLSTRLLDELILLSESLTDIRDFPTKGLKAAFTMVTVLHSIKA